MPSWTFSNVVRYGTSGTTQTHMEARTLCREERRVTGRHQPASCFAIVGRGLTVQCHGPGLPAELPIINELLERVRCQEVLKNQFSAGSGTLTLYHRSNFNNKPLENKVRKIENYLPRIRGMSVSSTLKCAYCSRMVSILSAFKVQLFFSASQQ